MNQGFIQLQRLGKVPLQQEDLRHRLTHDAAILAALDRQPILAQRFRVIAFLAERETEVVMRQLVPFRHLGRGVRPHALLGRLPLGAIALQRQIRLRPRERRIE